MASFPPEIIIPINRQRSTLVMLCCVTSIMCIITVLEYVRLNLNQDTFTECERYKWMVNSLGFTNFLVFAVSAMSLIAF